MNNDRNNYMITAGDLEIERESMEVSLDMDKDERAVTINTPYLSIFCCWQNRNEGRAAETKLSAFLYDSDTCV